jgi:hypothetical protein
VVMFASCCVCLVLVLSGFASGLLAHCVCTHVFAAVLGFALFFVVVVRCCRVCVCCGALFSYLFSLFIVWCGEVAWQFYLFLLRGASWVCAVWCWLGLVG